MNRAPRFALLILIFLCVISLAVILATALFSGRGGEDASGGEGVYSPPPSDADDGGQTADLTPYEPQPSAMLTPSPDDASSGASPSDAGFPDGTAVTFKASGSENTLVASVDANRFRHRQNGAEAFFDSTFENDRVYIEFCYFADKSADISAPGFLDVYVDHIDFNDRGVESVGRTGLSGRSVAATDGVNTFEAWLIDENQGGMLAIVMSYSDDSQAAALRAIFNSLALADGAR
jgi:hypothetical protein